MLTLKQIEINLTNGQAHRQLRPIARLAAEFDRGASNLWLD
jgi:hypothetical protein